MKMSVMMLVAAMPLMQFAATWYVAANGGSDDNDGKTEETAFATIQKGLNSAKSGDVIKVDDGEYAGFSDKGNAYKLVQSVNGYNKTFINGSIDIGYNPQYDYITVAGFTIQNGSGVQGGILRNCRITCCATAKEGSLLYCAGIYNCLIDNNTGYSFGGGNCRNCTFYNNSFRWFSQSSNFRNCVFQKCSGGMDSSYVYNSIQYDSSLGAPFPVADPCLCNPTNGDFRLTRESPCIDAGNNSYASGDVDLAGKARIFNETVDVGAYEWHKPETPVITPESGTLITDTSLTIQITCASSDASLHFTTNGTIPTMESPVYKKFKIKGRTMVMAKAFYYEGADSELVVAEYARGYSDDPTITPKDGTVFEHSGQVVTIDRTGEDGVLRYTIDGSDPTAESPEYTEPFTIDETTVVKAKVFGDQYFDSSIVTATLTRVWLKVATPEIAAEAQFTGSKQKVTLACDTEGALVRYTTDGKDPNSHSPKYTKPFYVTDTTTVKAYATKADYTNSDIGTFLITKVWWIGDTMGKPDHTFETSGAKGFVRVEDETATLGESMKSGAIADSEKSILSTTVIGPGTLTFKWKASCEEDDEYEWDHGEFRVNGELKGRINGETGWIEVSQRIDGEGTNTVTWTYVKDDVEAVGQDCIWVSDYAWASDYTETQTTEVPVPYDWLLQKSRDAVDEYDIYEKVAKQTAYNPRFTVEQCYVAGLDPESTTNEFISAITMEGGIPKITWTPDLGEERLYKVWGKESLIGGDWVCPTNSLHRFFKVSVEMP